MFDSLKTLLDSNLINEDAQQAINEAWESKLVEAKEAAKAELREEFGRKYEHDKIVMVEALDRMMTEGLSSEISLLREERQALVEDRVKFQAKIKEDAKKYNGFLVTKLAEEINELRKDRKQHKDSLAKMESFVVKALAREIGEFAQDKRAVVETKVRLVRDARNQLETLKESFVRESARKMSRAVSKHLKTEITQLHEDIKVARENNFGRRIFEAYAAEFGATYLSENAEIRKLHDIIVQKEYQLDEAKKINKDARVIVENKERELRILKESNLRESTLEELLSPLNKEKREVMRNLLESVQTARLKSAFEKYLPAVLEDRSRRTTRPLTESVSVATGDKTFREPPKEIDTSVDNVIELKRLAGL
jgi:hypothetical protein